MTLTVPASRDRVLTEIRPPAIDVKLTEHGSDRRLIVFPSADVVRIFVHSGLHEFSERPFENKNAAKLRECP